MKRWFERQRSILDLTLSSLWRRKGKNAALVLVYTALVFLLASVTFLAQALKREAALLLQGSPEIIVQKRVAGRHDLIPLDYAERLREIRGVQAVAARFWGYYYDPVTRANYTLVVPEEGLPAQGSVFVGAGVARLRNARKGDSLSLEGHDGRHLRLAIQGTFSQESELASSDLVLVSKEDFVGLFGIPEGVATDLTLAVRNQREVPTVATKIQSILPDTRVITKAEILRTYDAVFDWRGGMAVVSLFSSLLAFAILAWDKASGLSAEEKREIGILKAVGWETSDVLLLKLWEGTVISLSSFLAGAALAYVHVFLASGGLFAPVLKGWSTLYPRFTPVPFVSAYQVATLFFLTVLPYTAATMIPAWRSATVDPDSVMRA